MIKIKILELFAGTRSIGKAFEKNGHEVFSVEWDKIHKNIDWYVDIGTITAKDILEKFGTPDVIWTNHPNPNFKPICKNGDSCHVAAPRGSQTGTQGIKVKGLLIEAEYQSYYVNI